MAYGHKAFRRLQISNVEGTPGTPEAATEILYGTITVPTQDRFYHTPDQDRNSLAKIVELPFLTARKLEDMEITGPLYDRIMVFMASNAIRGNVTPTQPDNVNEPNHYLWTFEPALTTPNTPNETNGIDTFTLEWGDNIQGYEADYLFTVSLEITGEVGASEDAIVSYTWTVNGQQITESTMTAALTEEVAKYFPANIAKFYIDSSYAGLGGTQKSGVLKAFTWTFETGFSARYAADGTYVFSGINEMRKAPELELTFWRDSSIVEAELDKRQSDPLTKTFIRIELLSSGEMDTGQSNPPYIWLDGAYVYTDWPELDEEDETSVITVTATGVKDSTSGKMMTVSVGTTMDAFNA